jgi:uncharacterized membrane protein (UPF0127 family)
MVASSPLARIRGLLGRASLDPGEGLFISGTASIHTHFMRFPIDVVFLDDEGVAIRIVENLTPWRIRRVAGATSVLELPSGECGRVGLSQGDRLELPEVA